MGTMERLIEFNSKRLLNEWHSGKIDERLVIVLRALLLEMDGFRVTCLIRQELENAKLVHLGAVPNSKHMLNDEGLCCAADINPRREFKGDPDEWRWKVKEYLNKHFNGIDCVIQRHGTAPHCHIEIDTPRGLEIEIV